MRISFDLDDTLICYDEGIDCDPPLAWWTRVLIRDEPLRRGARDLTAELHKRGHTVWVYTSSGRKARWIKWWLRFHGIRVEGIVNGPKHIQCFGEGSTPSKRPHAFGIGLHVDNSRGVAMEGEQHGFNVCVVEPGANDWVERVLETVEAAGSARSIR